MIFLKVVRKNFSDKFLTAWNFSLIFFLPPLQELLQYTENDVAALWKLFLKNGQMMPATRLLWASCWQNHNEHNNINVAKCKLFFKEWIGK